MPEAVADHLDVHPRRLRQRRVGVADVVPPDARTPAIDDVEIAVAKYNDWHNHRWLHGERGTIPPVEYEAQFSTHPVAAGA
ncbi:hypothetical protein GTR02_01240 [Kineococcus sp. R8]|uniref:hypothetical protein n=1 Tax=Kineococcus siccus TaxID=2696567 RepID=UPI0014125651|nr:hypothetical protein [Kineococcus siccus]NAZ80443.1 hypothetical protein [Kineococcus siccus]